MKYSHKVIDSKEAGLTLKKNIQLFLEKGVTYRYQQCLFWFLCNAGLDNCELFITYLDQKIVAYSFLRKVRYKWLTKAKIIIESGPLYREPEALVVHLQEVVVYYASQAIDIRISPSIWRQEADAFTGQLLRAGFNRYRPNGGDYTSTVTISLPGGATSVVSSYSKALKRQLNKAGREGIKIHEISAAGPLRNFLSMLQDFYYGRSLGFPSLDILECFIKNKIFECSQGLVLAAEYKGKVVAGVIIIGCGERAIFTYGFKDRDASLKTLPLTHLLHHEAIVWACEQGYRLYDFGGFNSKTPEDGINRFKLGFSREITDIAENYICVVDRKLSWFIEVGARLKYRAAALLTSNATPRM